MAAGGIFLARKGSPAGAARYTAHEDQRCWRSRHASRTAIAPARVDGGPHPGRRGAPAGAGRARPLLMLPRLMLPRLMLIDTPLSRPAARGIAAGRPARASWRDEVWTLAIGGLDAVLRRLHGVREFCDDPACLIRIELDLARAPVALSDGAR